jgi:hypothetical protein
MDNTSDQLLWCRPGKGSEIIREPDREPEPGVLLAVMTHQIADSARPDRLQRETLRIYAGFAVLVEGVESFP